MPKTQAAKPTIKAIVTDKSNLSLGNQFGPAGAYDLTDTGDAIFPASGGVFRWDAATGARSRILQSGDPHPGAPGAFVDMLGGVVSVNSAGHAVMSHTFLQNGSKDSNGIFVYDGMTFLKVARRGEVAPGSGGQTFLNFPQFRMNDNDEVGFVGTLEPFAFGSVGLFIGSPSGPPSKIALRGEVAPDTGGGTFRGFTLIDINNAGEVAFIAGIDAGTTPMAVFIGTPSGIVKVAATGEAAPGTAGTFNLQGNNIGVLANPNYFLNDSGDLAFVSNVAGSPPANRGIWIGDGSGPPAKLFVSSDPTGTALGGNFGTSNIRGFNNAGKVLFSSNVLGGSAPHGLFLKDLSSAPDVVFAQNQPAPGGTTETFGATMQAQLNNNGDIAFETRLQGGPSPVGWFFRGAMSATVKIAFEGEVTPAGGTFGLAGINAGPRLTDNGHVGFFADILGLGQNGLFRWSSGPGLVSVVTTNDTLPAGANTVIRPFMPGASDDRIVFQAWKAGGRMTLFSKSNKNHGGQITRLFGEGDAAPSTGGRIWFLNPNFSLVNDEEEVAFGCTILGGSVYPAQAIFTHKAGFGLRKVVASGDPAPGGGTFASSGITGGDAAPPARINSQGQIAFEAAVQDGPSVSLGLFIGSAAGGVQKLARIGDPSPLGGTFIGFNAGNALSLNNSGDVAFQANSQDGPTITTALYVGSGTGSPAKLVAQGDALAGGTVSSVPGIFQMNNAGQVAYVVNMTGGPSPRGIFLGTAGGAQLPVALVGDTAPGSGGEIFIDFRNQTMTLNNAGQVAFWAALSGSTVTTAYYLGSATAAPAPRLLEG
ncbi:MAG TPA: choice-of-anchor tandem repeat NxxGxxAF-containing protein, partial [Blastocatellia bacterium]